MIYVKDLNMNLLKFQVYGIPRGGLIVAVLVSHKLGIPLITSLRDMYGKKFLVVDDIVDTALL